MKAHEDMKTKKKLELALPIGYGRQSHRVGVLLVLGKASLSSCHLLPCLKFGAHA